MASTSIQEQETALTYAAHNINSNDSDAPPAVAVTTTAVSSTSTWCMRPKNIARLVVLFYILLLPPLGYCSAMFFENTVASFDAPDNTLVKKSQDLASKFLPQQVLKDPAFMLISRKDGKPVVIAGATNQSSTVCQFFSFVGEYAATAAKKGYISADGWCLYLSSPSIAREFVSADGTKTLFVINMQSTSRKRSLWPKVEDRALEWLRANGSDLTMRTTSEGQLLDETEDAVVSDLLLTDSIAIPIALFILAAALRSFRQLLAAGLAIGITITWLFGIMYFVSTKIEISSFAPEGASACIVALSIDYLLFFASRYNERVKIALLDGVDIRNDEEEQYKLVRGTLILVAHNVLVSGTAIAVSLGSLILLPVSLLSSVGIAFTIGAVVAVFVAMTMTPALFLVFFNFWIVDDFSPVCKRLGKFGRFFLDEFEEDGAMLSPRDIAHHQQLEAFSGEHDGIILTDNGVSESSAAAASVAIPLQTIRSGDGGQEDSVSVAATSAAAAAAAAKTGNPPCAAENTVMTERQRRDADRLQLLADTASAEEVDEHGSRKKEGESGGEVADPNSNNDCKKNSTNNNNNSARRGSDEQNSSPTAGLTPTNPTSAENHRQASDMSNRSPPLEQGLLPHEEPEQSGREKVSSLLSPRASSLLSEESYEESLSPNVARRHQLARRAQNSSPWFKAGRFAVDHSCAVVIVILVLLLPFIAGVSLMNITFDLFAQVPRGSEKVNILDEVLRDIGTGAISAPFFVTIDTKRPGGLGSKYSGNLSSELGSLMDIEQLAALLLKNGGTAPAGNNNNNKGGGGSAGNNTNSSSFNNITTNPGLLVNATGFNNTVFQAVQQFAVYIAGRTSLPLNRITSYVSVSGTSSGFMSFMADALIGCSQSEELPEKLSTGGAADDQYVELMRGCRSYAALINRTIDPTYQVALLIIAVPFDSFGREANDFLTLLSFAIQEFNQQHSDIFVGGFFGASAVNWQILHVIIQTMPLQLSGVLAVIAIVAFVAFRSVFVPLRMIFTICVSMIFSFGAGVFLIQTPGVKDVLWGKTAASGLCWLIPSFALSLLISLSVDYDIFALTRIYELKKLGFGTRAATIKSVAKSGRVISFAAAIMAVSFASMFLSSTQTLQQFAILASVSVLVDAFIVRIFLTPALTTLVIPEAMCWWPSRYEAVDGVTERGLEDMTEVN